MIRCSSFTAGERRKNNTWYNYSMTRLSDVQNLDLFLIGQETKESFSLFFSLVTSLDTWLQCNFQQEAWKPQRSHTHNTSWVAITLSLRQEFSEQMECICKIIYWKEEDLAIPPIQFGKSIIYLLIQKKSKTFALDTVMGSPLEHICCTIYSPTFETFVTSNKKEWDFLLSVPSLQSVSNAKRFISFVVLTFFIRHLFQALRDWVFQASSFQLLKLENLLRWFFFTFIYNRSSNRNYFIFTLHHFTPHRKKKLTSLPMCDFIAQLVEHRTCIHRGHRFKSHWRPDFFRFLSSCLKWKIYCSDHSSLLLYTVI